MNHPSYVTCCSTELCSPYSRDNHSCNAYKTCSPAWTDVHATEFKFLHRLSAYRIDEVINTPCGGRGTNRHEAIIQRVPSSKHPEKWSAENRSILYTSNISFVVQCYSWTKITHGHIISSRELGPQELLQCLTVRRKLLDTFVKLLKGHFVLEKGPTEFWLIVDV